MKLDDDEEARLRATALSNSRRHLRAFVKARARPDASPRPAYHASCSITTCLGSRRNGPR